MRKSKKKVMTKKEYLKLLRASIKRQYNIDFDTFTDDMLIEFLNIDFSTVDWIE